jgi:Ca2+-binding EF-hand superfamily protein
MNIKNMGKTTIILGLAVAFLLAGTTGFSQTMHKKGPSTDEFFQRFDTDKDEKLTQEEFPGPDDHFEKLDENNDGFIAKNEMKEVLPPPRGKK